MSERTSAFRTLWLSIFSLFLVYAVAGLLFSRLFHRIGSGLDPKFWDFAAYVGSFVVTIGYACVLRRGRMLEIPSFRPEKWKADPRVVLSGVVLMLAAGIVLTPLLERMPDTYAERLDAYMDGGFWPMFTAVVAAPLLEEFLFRGIVQKNFVNAFGPLTGIVVASLLFGAIHLIPQQVVYATLLGLILGTVYCLTGSLLGSIAVHFVNNGLTVLLHMVFGRAGSVERRILGDGPWWDRIYLLSVLLLAGGAWYAVRKLRRSAATPNGNDSAEN